MQNRSLATLMPTALALMFVLGMLTANLFHEDPLTSDTEPPSIFKPARKDKISYLVDMILHQYVDTVSQDFLEELVIPLILDQLDPHSTYVPAREFARVNDPLQGNFDGIGVQFNLQEDTILIVRVLPGGPSEKAGLLAGDRIIRVNDTLYAGTGIQDDDVINALKGKKGSSVMLQVLRPGVDSLLSFQITRDKIPLQSIGAAFMLTPDVGYIRLSRFAQTSHQEFLEAAEKLIEQGMTRLVFDLRSNGGGYLHIATLIADEFLEKDKMILYTQGRTREREETYATDNGICHDMELAVLVDSWSASASEILAGALQDNDRAIIVGPRTFGKGLVQEPIQFPDQSMVRLTIARYYTPTGRSIQKPYDQGNEAYHQDIYHRFMSGQMEQQDSIHFADSLRFTTPGGKVVYGGGGIMPDVFVPVDSISASQYYNRVNEIGLPYKFVLNFLSQHRDNISKLAEFYALEGFLDSQPLLEQFLAFAKASGFSHRDDMSKDDRERLRVYIKAYIARSIFGQEAFHRVLWVQDQPLRRAIQSLGE